MYAVNLRNKHKRRGYIFLQSLHFQQVSVHSLSRSVVTCPCTVTYYFRWGCRGRGRLEEQSRCRCFCFRITGLTLRSPALVPSSRKGSPHRNTLGSCDPKGHPAGQRGIGAGNFVSRITFQDSCLQLHPVVISFISRDPSPRFTFTPDFLGP